jgi:hypothetical protein
MTIATTEFFAPLKRRSSYTAKRNGNFYSYEYYREHYRHEIAEDCVGRCVYCDCHENEVGGREAMELDHFRPWSRAEFIHLKNDPTNFLHVCGRCNRLKGANWPSTKAGEPHDGVIGFIDPFGCDRRDYFGVNADGSLVCRQHPARYMARLLALDRPLLRLLRVRRILRKEVVAYISRMLPEFEAAKEGRGSLSREQLAEAACKLSEFHRLLDLCDASLENLRDLASVAAGMNL